MLGTAHMKSSSRFVVLDSEPGAFVFGAWQNIRIAVWPQQATGLALERLDRITQQMLQAWPNGISTIHVTRSGPIGGARMSERLPTEEARAGFKGLIDRYAQLACVAVLIEGSGFVASTLRSVITGIRIDSGRP